MSAYTWIIVCIAVATIFCLFAALFLLGGGDDDEPW